MDTTEIIGWATCISTLLSAVITGVCTLWATRQTMRRQENRIVRGRIIYLSIALTSVLSGICGFIIRKIVFKEKKDLILFGSGSVYSYLSKEYKEIFNNTAFQVVRLDAPTLSAKRTIVYSFTRIEAQKVKLPSIIGMASYELQDSSFSIPDQKVGGDNIKFYAINIKEDTLIASFGSVNEAVKNDLGFLGKEKAISTNKLKIALQNINTVFIPTAESGTYKRWQELFKKNGITWPMTKIKIADVSPASQSDIYNTRGSWVALSSKNFNLAKDVKNLEIETMILDNSKAAVRPLYLYGYVSGEFKDNDDKYKYIIDDETIYTFWSVLLSEMSKNKQYASRAEAIRKNFLIDMGDKKLGVVFQPGREKVMVFDGN